MHPGHMLWALIAKKKNPNFNKLQYIEIRIAHDRKTYISPKAGGIIPKHVVSVNK